MFITGYDLDLINSFMSQYQPSQCFDVTHLISNIADTLVFLRASSVNSDVLKTQSCIKLSHIYLYRPFLLPKQRSEHFRVSSN